LGISKIRLKDQPVLGISPKKKPESKNWPVLGISKNQNKEPARFQVFQHTQRNSGFHERTDDSFLVLSFKYFAGSIWW
jgi:hypothetical protein